MMSQQHDFRENDVTVSWFPWKMMSQQHDFREKWCRSNMISVKNDVTATWFPRKMISQHRDFYEKQCHSIMITVKNDVTSTWFLWKIMSATWFLWKMMSQQHDFLQVLLVKTFSHNSFLLIKTVSKPYWLCTTYHCRKHNTLNMLLP